MRLPCVPQLSTKDGVSNKNARLTNTLKTTSATGEIAEVRPGLVTQDTYTGLGTGLIAFDGRLLAVYDDLIYSDEEFSWDLDAPEWDAGTTYDINDMVWYNGVMWFSASDGNVGNVPGTSGWVRWKTLDTWKEDEEYDIGDAVLVNGTKYFSYSSGNVGNTPSGEAALWKTTPPPSTRYKVNGWIPFETAPIAATKAAANEAWFPIAYATKPQACVQPNVFTVWYDSRHELIGDGIWGNQYANPNGRLCSEALGPFDIQIGTVITL
jgi:hypothetical protein